jgi:hypothetical protein
MASRRATSVDEYLSKRLDMGKSCVRFETLEDLALDAIAEVIGGTSVDEHIAHHEAARSSARERPARAAKKTLNKAAKKAAPSARSPAKRAVVTRRSRVTS